jgi:NAD(P)H dehydrogenase (quinone)
LAHDEDMVLGITGATGADRGKVAARLVESGCGQRLIVRVESRTPDLLGAEAAEASYDDPEAMRSTLADVRTFFMVSGGETHDR